MRTTRLLRLMSCLTLLASGCSGAGKDPGDPSADPDFVAPTEVTPTPTPSTPEPSRPTQTPTETTPGPDPVSPPDTTDPTRSLPPAPERIIPTDARPVVEAAVTPRAISGGTLLVTRDGVYAVASDPERARVSIVDLQAWSATEIALEAGDEPGRMVEDTSGLIHVVLRGAGEIATLDLADGSVLARRAVCPAPRGIDFGGVDSLLVACASGELVELPTVGTAGSTTRTIAADLRDVVVSGAAPLVTRFRSAEVLRVADEDASPSSARPARAVALFSERSGALLADELSPDLAYRLRRGENGALVMLHQVARDGVLEIGPTVDAPDLPENPGSYAGGGSDACRGIVQVAVSQVEDDGSISSSVRVPGTLAVDVAVSSVGTTAVAMAGTLAGDQPVPEVRVEGSDQRVPADDRPVMKAGVLLIPQGGTEVLGSDGAPLDFTPCAFVQTAFASGKQVTSVAFVPRQEILLALTREPAELLRVDLTTGNAPIEESLPLGGVSVADTGHELFTRNAGSGMACASCHAEGGDDGHTWLFEGLGPRRTQSLHVGLAGTAPFHWQGDEASFSQLVGDVMVERMGGVNLSSERIGALEQFVYELPAPPQKRASDDPMAVRGQALFEGQAECNKCHSGSGFSDGKAYDIGKGGALQVPSLVGIAYRTPLMHDGCAADLAERFEPACGGLFHGNTASSSAAQLDDLIAYLETL